MSLIIDGSLWKKPILGEVVSKMVESEKNRKNCVTITLITLGIPCLNKQNQSCQIVLQIEIFNFQTCQSDSTQLDVYIFW